MTLEEAHRAPSRLTRKIPQAELYMVGGASKAISLLPHRRGRVTGFGGPNLAPKTKHRIRCLALGGQKCGQKMKLFSGLEMRPHFGPYIEIEY